MESRIKESKEPKRVKFKERKVKVFLEDSTSKNNESRNCVRLLLPSKESLRFVFNFYAFNKFNRVITIVLW